MSENKYKKEATTYRPSTTPENIQVDYTFEKMLKSFTKQVEKENIIREIRERRYYTKPSEIRHKIQGSIERKRKLQRRRTRKK